MPLWNGAVSTGCFCSLRMARRGLRRPAEVAGEEIQVSDLLVVDGRVVALVSERPAFLGCRPCPGCRFGLRSSLISNPAQPLTTPRGRSRATRSASPAASHTLTTSSTSL